jgi:PKD repeat protein
MYTKWNLVRPLREMYDSREMIRIFLKGRLAAVPLVVLILLLVTACSLFNSPPVASFSVFPNSGSAPLVVSFDASSSLDTTGIIVAYEWEFGDETTGAGKVRTHTYELPGEYTARVTVTDDDGAKDSTTWVIQVNKASLTASFTTTPTSGEAPLSVDFDGVYLTEADIFAFEIHSETNTNFEDILIYLKYIQMSLKHQSTHQKYSWLARTSSPC